MRVFSFPLLLCFCLLTQGPVWAQTQAQTGGSALQASNILNPNVSVIGWFQGEAGHRPDQDEEEETPAFQLKEAEIAFQSIIDPYARADFFVAVEGEGAIDLEEGYITWFSLPFDLSLKLGKAKADISRFNRVHTPETSFADRPLVHEAYFGEEGLASVGAFLSWHVPNPWLLMSLDLNAVTMPEGEEAPAFDKAKKNDLLYVGRWGVFTDLTEASNLSFGGSYAHGTAGQEFDSVTESSSTLKSQIYGLDLTYRWKNPRRAIYRSVFWQTEILWNKRETSTASSVSSKGFFSHLEYQFARRWRTGLRYDRSESPTSSKEHDQGGLAYLTFMPSEFSLMSLQGRRVKKPDNENETLGWLKVTFNVGPHGTHPF